jgi:hypothetical protein
MEAAVSEQGYLLIADISGYTRFLTDSELDHAQGILESLLAVIVERLRWPLALSNLQGDAVFAYAPDNAISSPGRIFDTVEALYFGFRERVIAMVANTTCTCRACKNISGLDLKVILHHGSYVFQNIAGRQELSGPDVIVLHRLLKNDVTEKTGVRGYALLTEAAVKALGLPEIHEEGRAHAIDLEGFGTIEGQVIDLGGRWHNEQEQNPIIVSENEPLLFASVERVVRFDLAAVWEHLVDPVLRPRWNEGVHSITRTTGSPLRLRAGAIEHCAHGGSTLVLSYVHVRPQHHLTADASLPLNSKLRYSIITEPRGAETRIVVRIARPRGGTFLATLILRTLFALQAGKERATWERQLAKFEMLLAESEALSHREANKSANS